MATVYALIAESDPGQAALYRHLVLAEGFEPLVVRDGEAARRVMEEKGAPVLLITNLSLPREDGFTLLGALRKLATAQQSPAVVVTAFRALRETAARMKDELGIATLLDKGASLETVRKAIKRALAQNFSMRAPVPGSINSAPPATAQRSGTQPRIDLAALEQQRLRSVHAMGLVDDLPQDAALQELLAQAASEFGVATAVVALALEDKHWFKAHSGLSGKLLEERGVHREWPLCRQVVESNEPLVVPDAQAHPVFSQDALVKEGIVRGFAAAPLAGPDGAVLGALCLLDPKPLSLSPEGLDSLVQLARRMAGELELRSAHGRRELGRAHYDDSLRVEIAKNAHLSSTLAYLEAVLENMDSACYLLDQNRRVVFANKELGKWLGREPAALLGKSGEQLAETCSALFDDPEGFLRKLRVPSLGPFALREEFEVRRPRRRVVRWVAKPVHLDQGIGHLGIISDITAEADLAHERETLARTDSLTGLANRRGGEESLQREVSRSERGGHRLALALFDLDSFKQLNDSRGHAAGDEALRAVARVIIAAVRGADLVVRWGGDEMLAVLPSTGLEGARSLAERVRASVEALTDLEFAPLTVSAGVAELHQGEDEGQALARADARLYQAKAAGRNRVL